MTKPNKLSKVQQTIPSYRVRKDKLKPTKYTDDNHNINFSNLGKASSVNRSEIVKLINIQTRNFTQKVLNLPEYSSIDLTSLITFYFRQQHTNFFISDITEEVLRIEMMYCKEYDIRLLHADYNSINEIKRKYKYLSKYSRFLYIRNYIVREELNKKQVLFDDFIVHYDMNGFLEHFKLVEDKSKMLGVNATKYKNRIILYLFRTWNRYHDIDRLNRITLDLYETFEQIKYKVQIEYGIYGIPWLGHLKKDWKYFKSKVIKDDK